MPPKKKRNKKQMWEDKSWVQPVTKPGQHRSGGGDGSRMPLVERKQTNVRKRKPTSKRRPTKK